MSNHQATSLSRNNVTTLKPSKPSSRNGGGAWLSECVRWIVPSSTELRLPQSHERITALDKSSEQEHNHQSQGASPGKTPEWERFAGGFQGWPVPAEPDWGFPSAVLSLLYGFDSQHGKHELNLFQTVPWPRARQGTRSCSQCDIPGCVKGRTEDGAAEPTYFNKKTSWSCWGFLTAPVPK